jgi:hypothetical protein
MRREGRRAVLADRDHPLGGNAGDPIDDPEIALGHAEAMHASRMVTASPVHGRNDRARPCPQAVDESRGPYAVNISGP